MGDGCEAATWNLVWCGGQLIGGQIPKFLLVLILPPPLAAGDELLLHAVGADGCLTLA